MDNGKQLRSAGICQRLFCFIMKSLASQAAKPVTLGPTPVVHQQTRSPIGCRFDEPSKAKGVERVISIEIEDETRALLGCQEQRNGTGDNKANTKTARKIVSIKEEPEIICYPNKKRRKIERQILGIEGEMRPLRSILKVGSKLRDTSLHKTSPNSTTNTMM